jgi:hypothetical protein
MRKTPVVLGILSMIFGGLGLMWAAYTIFAQLFMTKMMGGAISALGHAMPHLPGQPDPGELFEKMNQLMKEMAPWFAGFAGVKGILSIVLLVVGWGLMKRSPSARRWALIWSAAAMAWVVGDSLFQILVYVPRVRELIEPLQTMAIQREMNQMAESSGWVVAALFNSAYPILLLILLGRPSAARDFDDSGSPA